MAVVTSFRKYVSLSTYSQGITLTLHSFVRNLGGTLGLAVAGTIM
jgi:hypothetical protein